MEPVMQLALADGSTRPSRISGNVSEFRARVREPQDPRRHHRLGEPLSFATQANAFHLKMWGLKIYVELITADRLIGERREPPGNSTDWKKYHK